MSRTLVLFIFTSDFFFWDKIGRKSRSTEKVCVCVCVLIVFSSERANKNRLENQNHQLKIAWKDFFVTREIIRSKHYKGKKGKRNCSSYSSKRRNCKKDEKEEREKKTTATPFIFQYTFVCSFQCKYTILM